MKTTRLGNTGLTVSRICLGMMTYGTPQWRPWVLDEAASKPLVKHAVELGINFFDTADMYSAGESEVLTGRFLREFCRRDEIVIASKVYFPVDMVAGVTLASRPAERPNQSGLSRKRIFHAVDASLKRLDTDYIDLYQIHRWDDATPIEETMQALHDVVKAGKVRYLGASSMWAWQFAKAQQVARTNGWTPFVSMQNHYNLAYREEEREMIPLCRDQGVALVPWSPLARGFLARQPQERRQERGCHLARPDRRHRADLLLPRERLRHRRAPGCAGRRQGGQQRDAGLRLAAPQGRHGTDHRCEQAAPARPGGRGRGPGAERRRSQLARGRLRAAPGHRPRLTRFRRTKHPQCRREPRIGACSSRLRSTNPTRRTPRLRSVRAPA